MVMEEKAITPKIAPDELARIMGGRKGRILSSSVRKTVETWNEKIDDLIEPHVSYVKKPIRSVDRGGVHLGDDTYFKSPKIAKTLKDCSEVVCFIATIDHGVEEEVHGLMDENRLSDAYILDSMGSVAVENMVNQFHERMEKRYKEEGKSVTLRFSPGYCDWQISEQKKLFNLFDQEEVAVELRDDSCLMAPRKSVSGVFGVLPYDHGETIAFYNPCGECGNIHCIARRAENSINDNEDKSTH